MRSTWPPWRSYGRRFTDIKNDASMHIMMFTGAGEKAFITSTDMANWLSTTRDIGQGVHAPRPICTQPDREPGQARNCLPERLCTEQQMQIAMACTMHLAGENAKLGQQEVNSGMIPVTAEHNACHGWWARVSPCSSCLSREMITGADTDGLVEMK